MRSWALKAFWLIVFIGAGVGLGVLVNYRRSFHKVSLTIHQGLHVAIYPAAEEDSQGLQEGLPYDEKKAPLFKLDDSRAIKLKNGTYEAVVDDPTHEYSNSTSEFVVNDLPVEVTVDPDFSDKKLVDLLAKERPAIQQSMAAAYPDINKIYKVSKERLYKLGGWYAAALKPADPSQDLLRIILQKKNNTWTVVTNPPAISIGKPSHTTIPYDVIDDIDNFQ